MARIALLWEPLCAMAERLARASARCGERRAAGRRTGVDARAAHAPAQLAHGGEHARRAKLVRGRKAQVVV